MFGQTDTNVIKRSAFVETKDRAPSPPTVTTVTVTMPVSDKPLSQHPDKELLEKMLNMIEEEDIPDFIASIRESFTFTMIVR